MIKIEPIEIITKTTISAVEIGDGQIILNKSVKFPVKKFDENGSLIGADMVEISGLDYDKWSTDDRYIINAIVKKLGFEKVYDKDLISMVENLISGQSDGRISKNNAKTLIDLAKSEGVTELEKDTIYYIRNNFNWTDAAEKWFDENY